jgi:HSP20 family protein
MTLLMRPDPFSTEVSRLFNTLLGGAENGNELQRWSPAMDLVEGEDHFLLRADLPGLDEEDVQIEVHDNTLRISGRREAEHEQKERGWYRMERSFGSFSRSLTLPDGVNADAIAASFDKGVLEVRIPKPEERQPRRVQIQSGESAAVEGTATENTKK